MTPSLKWRKGDWSVDPNWATLLPGGLWLVVTLRGTSASLFLLGDVDSVQIGYTTVCGRHARDAKAWAEATAAIVFRTLGNHFKEPRQ